MGFKQQIATAFLAMTQALPAQAQEEKGPYETTHECAVQSLRDTFPADVEIFEEKNGVGGFSYIQPAEGSNASEIALSSIISINPDTNLVEYIDVQANADGAGYDVSSLARLTYETGQQDFKLVTMNSAQKLNDTTLHLTETLDKKMRACESERLLSGLSAPSFRMG